MSRTRTSPSEIASQARHALRAMELAIRKARFDRVGNESSEPGTTPKARSLTAEDSAHTWRKAG